MQFNIKINNTTNTNNYDFVTIILTHMNNKYLTLSNENKITNIIINQSTINKNRIVEEKIGIVKYRTDIFHNICQIKINEFN